MASWEISPVMLQGDEVTNNRDIFKKMNNNDVFYGSAFGEILLENRMVASGKENFLKKI